MMHIRNLQMVVAVCCLFLLTAFPLLAAELRQWSGDAPSVSIETDNAGFSRLVTADDRFHPSPDAVGLPALPCRTLLFALPDRAEVVSVSFDVAWAPLADNVKIAPVSEPVRVGETAVSVVPDSAVYGGGTPYPETAAVTGRVERMCGVRVLPVMVTPFRWHPDTGLLEKASGLTVRVTFDVGTERSYVLAADLLDTVRGAVVNAADVCPRPVSSRTMPSRLQRLGAALPTVNPVCLLIAPPDFFDDWKWYAGKRKETHPDVTFVVTNTADIYAEYPFGETRSCRNAAESIHAFLRDSREKLGFGYVVLGGAWLDAQDRKRTAPRFYGGELMSLSNCVPGIYGYPREEWREIPSDMFYACLDLKDGQRYPWDANEDGVYIDQADCRNNDLLPDVAVSRITLNPYRPNGLPAYNRHELVTNYVAKLARGEAKDFVGHYRYGVSPDSTGGRHRRSTGNRMFYKEMEFYDNMYNMFDPRHSEWVEDNEYSACGRLRDQFSRWRPVLEVKGMMNNTWTKGQSTLAAALDDYYASDRDYGFVYSHGWAQGATHFQAGRFATGRGLTLLNGSNGPCDTGYVDYHVTMNGVLTLQYNLGDSGVSNPDGGALCSINNTRWGWAGGSNGWDESMSYLMLNRSLIGFNQLGKNVGQSWLKGVWDYASLGGPQNGGTSTWTLTEQICYGDPLVRLPTVPDAWWTGSAQGGIWDGTTDCWSNSVDMARTYSPASNVCIDVAGDFALDITTNVAAMRLFFPVRTAGATVRLTGADSGSLRVMSAIDVEGTDPSLELGVRGGVGHSGVRFLSGPGTLTFTGTNEFYLASVSNAAALRLNGAGVTVDADEFPANTTVPLSVTGLAGASYPAPNVLRSAVAGGLRRFGDFGITNGFVRLSTVDAFGNDTNAPAHISLSDAHLDIGANVYYERDTCMEGLNATFDVDGSTRLSSSVGGLFTVKHITTFNLRQGAKLTLAAHTVDGGGRIVINGDGETTLEVPLADALSGDVTVGPGVRLVLDALPLENVKSLRLEEGAELVLPHAMSGYWQLLPLSSKLDCAAGVTVYDASDLVHPLDGTPSATGSFFRQGALYTWKLQEGDWDAAVAREADKIVFADVDGGSARVHVRLSVAPSFAYFSNAATRYVFDAPDEGPSVTFNGVVLNGDTDFRLPVFAREYVSLTGGATSFARLVAPYVSVATGASLALTGSHWTEFRLANGSVLKAVPGEALDWNLDTRILFADGAVVTLDVGALDLTETPQVLIAGEGHVWTEDDYARFTLSRPDAELRLKDGALAVVKGSGLKSPYELQWNGVTNWNAAAWVAANAVFPTNWSACTLNDRATVRLETTNAVLDVDCAVRAGTLALSVTADGGEPAALSVEESAGGSLDVRTIDCAEVQGCVRLDIATGAAAVLGPTNENAEAVLVRTGSGLITMRGGSVRLETPGDWTLVDGAQGVLTVRVPPTNRVVRLAKLTEGFGYPNGGFAVRVVDGAGVERTDCVVAKEGSTLVLVPSVIDVGDIDFAALAENAVAGAPYSHWLVRGAVSGSVAIENLPTDLPAGVTVAVETSGAFGVRLIVSAPEVKLGSVSINFAGGRGGEPNLPAARVSDNADCRFLPHGAHAVVGTNWNDVAAANGDYAVETVVLRDGSVASASAVRMRLSNVANPYTTGSTAGDRILYGYLDDGRSPVVELSGIPFGKYRIIVYRSTDDAGKSFDSCRIGTSEANAVAYYGPTVKSETGGVTLSGADDMGWGFARVRDRLEEGVNYIVSDVLTGGRAYLASRRDFGRGCLSAIQIVEVDGEPAADPVRPVTPLVLRATATDDVRWSRLDWYDTNDCLAAEIDWTKVASVTLAGAVGATVAFDRGEFAGALTLLGGVSLEAHELPAFTLQAGSTGSVRYFYTDEPAADTLLVKTAADYAGAAEDVTVVSSNRFGIASTVHASVGWKTGGYYVHVDDIDHPTYSFTFEGSTDKTITQAIGLSEGTSDPAHFELSRGGLALTGRTPYFSGLTVPDRWSLNIVARMPADIGGVVYGMGRGGAAERGLALAAGGGDLVSLMTWTGWSARPLLTVSVPFATQQFHAYALTQDGTNLTFYVDGEARGTVAAPGCPSEGHSQFFKLYSNNVSPMCNGMSGAIDDWRFYSNVVLTAESVKGLADEFRPWPECRTAVVSTPSQTMNDLHWGDGEASMPKVLVGAGGSLRLAGELAYDVALRVRGEALTVAFFENAQLIAEGGLVAEAPLTLDVSALSAAQLAKYAVSGLPYVRWLVRGTVSGEVNVTGLPEMPNGYHVAVETLPTLGVCLRVTAPRSARFGSVGISVGSADVAAVSEDLGIYPAANGEWFAYGTWSTTPVPLGGFSVAGSAGGKVDPTSPFGTGSGIPRFFWNTSFDGDGSAYDGKTNGLVLAGISDFAQAYRVVVYLATDTANAVFGPVTIGGRTYTGAVVGEPAVALSLADSTALSWGRRSAEPAEGVTAVVSDVLTDDTLTVFAKRHYEGLHARGQIAAVQIVRVGEILETDAVDYRASVTADTPWREGAGEGLVPSGKWQNDLASEITLSSTVARATVSFDTPVTAAVLRVTGGAGSRLTLARRAGVPFAIPEVDLTESRGEVAFTNWADDVTLTGVRGARLRFEDAVSRTMTTLSGAVVAYREAVFNPGTANIDWVLRLEDAGDRVTLDGTTQYVSVDLAGGVLTWPKTTAGVAVYGGISLAGTNSVLNVCGGTFACNLTGDGSNTGNQRGFILGNARSASSLPRLIVSAGLFDCAGSVLSPWENPIIIVSGGTLRTLGIVKGGYNAGSMTVSGGVVELGRRGIGAYDAANAVRLPVTLKGGIIRATASCTLAQPVTVQERAALCAAAGATLSVGVAPTGTGTLACGGGSDTGAVVFTQGVEPTVALEGTFALHLTAAQTNAEEEVTLFRTTAAFDRNRVTLCGPDGAALPTAAGELVVRDGRAVWVAQTANVSVEIDGATVRVPRAWLRVRSIDPATLAANPTLSGANGLPVAVSYALGLEPTNVVEDIRCAISIGADGALTLDLPQVDPARQPNPGMLRYVLQHKAELTADWKDHSTNSQKTVTVAPDESPTRFYRYLILLK